MNFCKKHKKICWSLNYVEHLLILISAVTGCALVSTFASVVSIPIGIACSAVKLKTYTKTTRTEKYKSIDCMFLSYHMRISE